MRLSWCSGLVLLLATVSVLAQLNTGLIFSELPACVTPCFETGLPAASCAVENMQECLCRNTTLQSELYTCSFLACDMTDLITSITVRQNLICHDIPQPSRSGTVAKVFIAFTVLATTAVLLRIYSRRTLSHFWWDDWAIVAAGLLLIPISAMGILNAKRGYGGHFWNFQMTKLGGSRKLYYVCEVLYEITKTLAKASILLLFLRIFPDDRFRLYTKIYLVFLLLSCIALVLITIFQCTPINAVWDFTKGKCINTVALIWFGAALSLTEDIVIIIFPIPQLTTLNLSLRKKLAVIFMFAIGSFACIASLVRLKYLITYDQTSLDTTWDGANIQIWTFLEVYTAVIAACIITIRPLFAKAIPSLFHTRSGSTSYPATFMGTVHTHPRRASLESISGPWDRNHGSAQELKSHGGLEGWAGGMTVQDEENRELQNWARTSVHLDSRSIETTES